MKSRILAELEKQVWSRFSKGAIKPVIYRTMPITRAEEAHAILRNRENIGKVVLEVP
jgi:NADPH2:quinone reductase